MPENGDGYIRISNRELYDMMVQVRDQVKALENRVDNEDCHAQYVRLWELSV